MNCTDNQACRINELCYADTEWFQSGDFQTVGPSSGQPGCLCNTFYGFEGRDCGSFSSSSVITMVWQLATTLFGICVAVLLAGNARDLHRLGRLRTSLSMSTTVALCMGSTVSATLWAFFGYLSVALIRSEPSRLVFDFKDQYKGRFNSLNIVFAPAALALGALALLHVSLTWLEIAIHSNQLSSKQTTRLTATRRYVYVFEAAAVVLGVSGATYEKSVGRSIMGFMLAPLVVFIILVYGYSALRLTEILHEASRGLTAAAAATPRSGASSAPSSKLDVERPSFSLGDLSGLEPESSERSVGSRKDTLLGRLGRPVSAAVEKIRNVRGTGASGDAVVVRETEGFANYRAPGTPRATAPKARGSPDVFMSAVLKVRNTALSICACLVLFLIATVGISAVDNRDEAGWKEHVKPGAWAPVKGYHHLQMTTILLSQCVIAVYIGARASDAS